MPPLFQNLKNLIATEGRIGVQWERPNLDLDFSKDSAFRGPPVGSKVNVKCGLVIVNMMNHVRRKREKGTVCCLDNFNTLGGAILGYSQSNQIPI